MDYQNYILISISIHGMSTKVGPSCIYHFTKTARKLISTTKDFPKTDT